MSDSVKSGVFTVPNPFPNPSPGSLAGSNQSTCSTTSSDTPSPGNRGSASPPIPNNMIQKACKCKECGKIFNSVWYLKQHAVKHSSDRPFKCKFCHKTYRFRSNLYQHKCPDRDATVGPRGLKRSKLSVIKQANSPDLITTMQDVSLDYKISHISEVVESLVGHNNKLHNNGIKLEDEETLDSEPGFNSPCDRIETNYAIEEERFVKKRQLEQEEIDKFVEEHRNQLHQCMKCQAYFPSREYLVRHTASHTYIDGRTQCLHCSEIFLNDRLYAKHKQRHTPNSFHCCHKCRGNFVSRLSLRRHLLHCTGRRDMPEVNLPLSQFSFISTTPPHENEENQRNEESLSLMDPHNEVEGNEEQREMGEIEKDPTMCPPAGSTVALTVNTVMLHYDLPNLDIIRKASCMSPNKPGAKNVFTSLDCNSGSHQFQSTPAHSDSWPLSLVLLTPPPSPVGAEIARPDLAHNIPTNQSMTHMDYVLVDNVQNECVQLDHITSPPLSPAMSPGPVNFDPLNIESDVPLSDAMVGIKSSDLPHPYVEEHKLGEENTNTQQAPCTMNGQMNFYTPAMFYSDPQQYPIAPYPPHMPHMPLNAMPTNHQYEWIPAYAITPTYIYNPQPPQQAQPFDPYPTYTYANNMNNATNMLYGNQDMRLDPDNYEVPLSNTSLQQLNCSQDRSSPIAFNLQDEKVSEDINETPIPPNLFNYISYLSTNENHMNTEALLPSDSDNLDILSTTTYEAKTSPIQEKPVLLPQVGSEHRINRTPLQVKLPPKKRQKKLRFSCPKCREYFSDRWALREHMLNELGFKWKDGGRRD